jgi:hypothetical protein
MDAPMSHIKSTLLLLQALFCHLRISLKVALLPAYVVRFVYAFLSLLYVLGESAHAEVKSYIPHYSLNTLLLHSLFLY